MGKTVAGKQCLETCIDFPGEPRPFKNKGAVDLNERCPRADASISLTCGGYAANTYKRDCASRCLAKVAKPLQREVGQRCTRQPACFSGKIGEASGRERGGQ